MDANRELWLKKCVKMTLLREELQEELNKKFQFTLAKIWVGYEYHLNLKSVFIFSFGSRFWNFYLNPVEVRLKRELYYDLEFIDGFESFKEQIYTEIPQEISSLLMQELEKQGVKFKYV